MEIREPDIKFAGFSLWVLGQEFPDSNDYWDGNWLNVRAQVEAVGASVEARGAIVRVPELMAFADELELLNNQLTGEASLKCMEPNLEILFRSDSLGHVTATIAITQDHITQSHKFIFSADQTFLRPLIAQCKSILSRWPIKGTR